LPRSAANGATERNGSLYWRLIRVCLSLNIIYYRYRHLIIGNP
jgi:hypothetical protein